MTVVGDVAGRYGAGRQAVIFQKKNLPPLVMAVTVFVLQNPLAGIEDDGRSLFLIFFKTGYTFEI
jgi:hypothetical protein